MFMTALPPASYPHPTIIKVAALYEQLTLERAEELTALYATDARFKDPFNDVRGHAEIRRIFSHMFTQVDAPTFIVTRIIASGNEACLIWEFRFRMRRWQPQEQCILGSSHLIVNADGKISLHRDYWDAAEELYEKLPVLGSLMRWLKARART
jgi:steroid Delta-isomerase